MMKTVTRETIAKHLPVSAGASGLSISIVLAGIFFLDQSGYAPWQAKAGELEQRIEATEEDLDEIAENQDEIAEDVSKIELAQERQAQALEGLSANVQTITDHILRSR